MKILLIRHAQSVNNALLDRDPDARCSPDPALTDLGQQQAVSLATYLAGHPWRPNILWTSLMKRAAQTSAPVVEQLNVPVRAWPDLHERPGPYLKTPEGTEPYPGLSASDLQAILPTVELPKEAGETGWHQGPIETSVGTMERAYQVLDRLASEADSTPGPLAVITHGHFLTAMLMAIFGAPAESGWGDRVRCGLRNTSVTGVEFIDGTWWVRWLDEIAPDASGQHVPRTDDFPRF